MDTTELYPDFFARFYDVIYQDLRTDDKQFFMTKIMQAEGPVLEVGTGTGRFFMEALKNGADIHGIDVSPAMLGVLERKLDPEHRHRIRLADMCTFESNGKYKLIVAPFRVFMHIHSIEDQLKALATMHTHLMPGGSFHFDVFVPNLRMLSEGLDDVLDFEGEYAPGKKVKRYTSMHADAVQQISHVTFRLEWEENNKVEQKVWNTSMRLFFYHELIHLLSRSKFQRFTIHGDFLKNPVSATSKEFVVSCEK